jgi:hypothetical protein
LRKLDTLPAQETAPDAHDDLLTIEAPTVEAAMARLASEVGDDARIVSAEKVTRGGIGGFFAKEAVVLTARRPETDRSSLPGVLERMTTDADLQDRAFGDVLRGVLGDRAPSAGLGSLLDAAGWTSPTAPGADAETTDAGRVDVDADAERAPAGRVESVVHETTPPPITVGPLVSRQDPVGRTPMEAASIVERSRHEHLVTDPPDRLTTPGIAVPGLSAALGAPSRRRAPAEVATAALGAESASTLAAVREERTDPPVWDATDLVRQGLPGRVVAAVRDIDPSDDLAWMSAISGAVEPWCGRLPDRDMVVVGAAADRLASTLGLPLIGLGDVAPYEGTFCSVLTGAPDDRTWLDFVRGNRSLHLVLGDDELWRDLLVADPDVVSWITGDGLVDALYLASTLGSTLGFGAIEAGDRMLRARPIDVALDIRRIVRRA